LRKKGEVAAAPIGRHAIDPFFRLVENKGARRAKRSTMTVAVGWRRRVRAAKTYGVRIASAALPACRAMRNHQKNIRIMLSGLVFAIAPA
jgi:hypothetical protein